jgi:hypothetical protein
VFEVLVMIHMMFVMVMAAAVEVAVEAKTAPAANLILQIMVQNVVIQHGLNLVSVVQSLKPLIIGIVLDVLVQEVL